MLGHDPEDPAGCSELVIGAKLEIRSAAAKLACWKAANAVAGMKAELVSGVGGMAEAMVVLVSMMLVSVVMSDAVCAIQRWRDGCDGAVAAVASRQDESRRAMAWTA